MPMRIVKEKRRAKTLRSLLILTTLASSFSEASGEREHSGAKCVGNTKVTGVKDKTSLKRPWAGKNGKEGIDLALLKTANSLAEVLASEPEKKKEQYCRG